MAANEILLFAHDPAANVQSQAVYDADPQREIGHQPGIAKAEMENKALRQVSLIAAGVAQFIADLQATDVEDTLTPANIAAMLLEAVEASTVVNSSVIQPISSSVAGNALTVGHAGGVPIDYRSSALNNGAVSTITGGALTVVAPAGATFGSIAATPFRLWIAKVLDAGVEYLALQNTQIVNGINVDIAPVNEGALISTTLLDAASDSAGVWYSTAAHANCPFRLVGYIDLTEAVAGTYATAPSTIQGMSDGIKKPGEVVQRVIMQNNTWSASGGVAVPANDAVMLVTSGSVLHTKSFTPTSGVNLIKGNLSGSFGVTNSTTVNIVGIFDAAVCKRSATFKVNDSNDYQIMALDFCYQALTAVARTIQSRFSNDGTAAYVNGIASGRKGGGAQAAVFVIEEIQA